MKMDIITVEKRDTTKKAKQLRRIGIVPCVIYGGALKESISIQMDNTVAIKVLRNKHEGSKLQIKLEDQIILAQIKDKTRDTLNNEIIQISFQALQADQKVNSVTHIIFQNEELIKGILEKMIIEVPYAALPEDMVDTITIDIEGRPIGETLTVGDMEEFKTEKVELQIDKDAVICKIVEKKGTSTEDAE